MRIVKISELSEEEKEKWQQQVQAREQNRQQRIIEEQKRINQKRNGSVFSNTQKAQPLPMQNFEKLVQTKKQEEKAKKQSTKSKDIELPIQGPTKNKNISNNNVNNTLLPMPTQTLKNVNLNEATELTNNEYKAMQEAKKINQDMKNGDYNSAIGHVIKSPVEGMRHGISGIANAGLIPVATMLQAYGNRGQELGILKDEDNFFNNSANKVLDVSDHLEDNTSYNNKVNARLDNNVVRTASNVGNTIGNMLPAVASNIVAPGSGLVVTGLSSGGNSARETINYNRDNLGQATLTGVAKGAVEAGTEMITGGNILSKGSLDDIVNQTIAKKIKGKVGREIANKGYQFLGEMAEEQISDNLGYVIDKLVNDKDMPDFKEWWDNAGETNKMTFLTTLTMNMVGLGGGSYVDQEANKYLNEAQKIIDQEKLRDTINAQQKNTQTTNLQQNQTQKQNDTPIQQSIQENTKTSQNRNLELKEDRLIYKDNNGNDNDIYFRFDDENGFRGAEHESGVSMWEDHVEDLISENYDIDNDRNKLLEDIYNITQEEYDALKYEEQLKIKREIAKDKGWITQGASVFDLTNEGLEFFESYDSDHHVTDYPEVNFFTGTKNEYGIDGENVVIPNEEILKMSTKDFLDIIDEINYDDKFEDSDATQKNIELMNRIKEKVANNQETLYNNIESEGGINERENKFTNSEETATNERGVRRYNEPMQGQERGGNQANIENTKGENTSSGIFGVHENNSTQQTIADAYNDTNAIKETIDYANKNKVLSPSKEILEVQNIAKELGINVVAYNGENGNKHLGLLENNTVYLDVNKNNISMEDGSIMDRFSHEVLHYIKRNTSFNTTIKELQTRILNEQPQIIDSFIESKGYDVSNIPNEIKNILSEEILADYSAKHISGYDIDYGLPEDITYVLNTTIDDAITELKLNSTNNQKTQNEEILPPTEKMKQRKHYKSIIESSYTTDEAKAIAKELMGTDTYVPESNVKQLERADKRIEMSGAESELDSIMSRAILGDKITADDIAVGERLIQYYSKSGEKGKLQEAIQATAMAGTTAGQTVQALSLLNHQTPEGQAVWLQRSIDKMNNDLKRMRGEKAEQFNLTPEMLDKIVNSKNKIELEKNLNEVYAELGQQVSKTLAQKVDAWRYFSMLANPRTHIRNIVGNKAMGGMQYGIKNKIAGAIEGVVGKFNPDMERTHTIAHKGKELKDFAKNDIVNVADRLGLNENKYNPKTRLENNMRTFKSNIMEKTLGKAFEFNNKALEVEDGWGLKAGYAKSLAEYMKANKLTPKNITDEQLGKARNHAIQEAKEATFHQESQIASLTNQLSNKNKFAKFALDAILPFKKTPINVAKTGIEYSPVGLVKSAIYDVAKLRKGDITVNKYIDNVSKGITGTGISLIGYFLASCGILKASGSDDDKKENYDENRGNQAYSIKIGNQTFSLDWLAPSGIPLFIGAETYEIMKNQKETGKTENEDSAYNQAITTATNILDGFTNAMNPMTEMSMLSGLSSALKSYDQGSSQMFANIGTNAVKSYANQFVPTALKQIAKTTDEHERSTTSTKTGVLPKAVDTFKNQVMSGIPGARQMLPIKTDTWGNEVKQNDNVFVRGAENMIFPWTRKEVTDTKVDNAINDLYKETGESSILPTAINKQVTIEGKNYRLTNEEYSKYKKDYGNTSYALLQKLTSSKEYKQLTEEQKQKAIENVYSYAKEKVKIDYANTNNLNVKASTLYKTMEKLKQEGGVQSEYLNYTSKIVGIEKSKEKIDILVSSNYSEKTKKIIYSETLGKEDEMYSILDKTDININEYLKYKTQKFESDRTDDGTTEGKAVSGSKKKKVLNYINNMNITYNQKLLLCGSQYNLANTEKTRVANYINGLNIKKDEKIDIYEKMQGFTVYKDGRVKW